MKCRKCVVCENTEHHWMAEYSDERGRYYICKHCPAEATRQYVEGFRQAQARRIVVTKYPGLTDDENAEYHALYEADLKDKKDLDRYFELQAKAAKAILEQWRQGNY